jgi:hypothetical protein
MDILRLTVEPAPAQGIVNGEHSRYIQHPFHALSHG